jgi:hypothetical protein
LNPPIDRGRSIKAQVWIDKGVWERFKALSVLDGRHVHERFELLIRAEVEAMTARRGAG